MNEYNIIHKPTTVWQIYLIKAFRCHVWNFWIGPEDIQVAERQHLLNCKVDGQWDLKKRKNR